MNENMKIGIAVLLSAMITAIVSLTLAPMFLPPQIVVLPAEGPTPDTSEPLKKTWVGSSDKTTDIFYVPTSQVKISWDIGGIGEYSVFVISIWRRGDDVRTKHWIVDGQPNGETYAYIKPGYYYLDFDEANCGRYTVTVESVTR